MFDTYHAGNYKAGDQTVKINAVTGAILKNHPKSWFERFNLNSDRAKRLFKEGGDKGEKEKRIDYDRYLIEENPDNAITVLQMVVCGDMEVLAECVYTKDYELATEKSDECLQEESGVGRAESSMVSALSEKGGEG